MFLIGSTFVSWFEFMTGIWSIGTMVSGGQWAISTIAAGGRRGTIELDAMGKTTGGESLIGIWAAPSSASPYHSEGLLGIPPIGGDATHKH